MLLYDCHMHSSFSDDSQTDPVLQIEKAVELNKKGICFTDHMDLDYPSSDPDITFVFDTDDYYGKLCALREHYKDKLDILIGIEIGLRNESDIAESMKVRYEALTSKYDFDFVIGSTHCLEHTDPYYESYWNGKNVHEGLANYFKACCYNAAYYDCYDSFGHTDYVVRYVPEKMNWKASENYKPADYSDYIDDLLKTLISREKALEVNTAGLKYGLGFVHPHDFILKRYLELGGELVTVGADGHKPEHIFYDFDAAGEYLKALGFKYYAVYRKRKPEFIKL